MMRGNSEKRFGERGGRRAARFFAGTIPGLAVSAGMAISSFFADPSTLFAQSTVGQTVQSDGSVVPSAVGILTPHLSGGRFGTYVSGGYLSPSANQDGRFSSGAVLTPSGGFVGMNNNLESSRFGSYWEQRPSGFSEDQPLSQRDLLIYLRSQRNKETARNRPTESPQQVSAVPYDEPLPYRQPGGEAAPTEASQTVQNVQTIPQRWGEERTPSPDRPSEQIWMRGSASRRTPVSPHSIDGTENGGARWDDFGRERDRNAGYSADAPRWNSAASPLNRWDDPTSERGRVPLPPSGEWDGGVIGGRLPDLSAEEARSLPSAALARNGRQERQRQEASTLEYLESLILKSPVVSPLSPIKVTLSGSAATVMGIVPTEESRIEAGRILLTDPRVASVDNQLTVFSKGDDKPLPKPFDPNLSEPNR